MGRLSKFSFVLSVVAATFVVACGLLGCGSGKGLPSGAEPWLVGNCVDDRSGASRHLSKEPIAGSSDRMELAIGSRVAVLEKQGAWSRVRKLEKPGKGREGWVHVSCTCPEDDPVGCSEVYRARLSTRDHVNSKGKPLDAALAVVRQDRANVHKFGKADQDDTLDSTFSSRKMRSWLNSDADVKFAPGAEQAILTRTPYVEVTIGELVEGWGGVRVEVLEPGEPYTAPKKKRRKKADPAAVSRCVEKWCNFDMCPDECPQFKRCLGKAGVPKAKRWGCWDS